MASAAAQRYFNSFSPQDQQNIRNSWGGADLMDEWFKNAVNAGAIGNDGTMQSRQGSFGGSYGGQMAEGGYSTNVSGGSGLTPGMTPTPRQLRQYAKEQGWSEDFDRYSDAQLQAWLNQPQGSKDGWWDPQAMRFHSNSGGGLVDKPDESAPGETPAWAQGGGGGGGGGGNGGGGGGGSFGQAGGVPQFNFTAPSYEDMLKDPSYQARLGEGLNAIQHSAAAKGMLRTGNTVSNLGRYAGDFASQEYDKIYDRSYQYARDKFAPQYGGWQTMYGGDLSRWTTNQNAALQKYLQREGNIYGVIMGGQPTYNTGISGGYGY